VVSTAHRISPHLSRGAMSPRSVPFYGAPPRRGTGGAKKTLGADPMPQARNYEARDHRTEGSRGGARERTSAPRRRSRRPSTGRTAGFVLLYVACVIGASVLLACIGWIAAGDLLALNKEPKTVTITISSDDSFSDVTDRLKEEGLIEYKFLFKLFAAVTGGDDDVTMGTY